MTLLIAMAKLVAVVAIVAIVAIVAVVAVVAVVAIVAVELMTPVIPPAIVIVKVFRDHHSKNKESNHHSMIMTPVIPPAIMENIKAQKQNSMKKLMKHSNLHDF
jgi:hypothetical protein